MHPIVQAKHRPIIIKPISKFSEWNSTHYKHSRHRHRCMLKILICNGRCMLFLLGCAPKIEPESAPIPPNIIEKAASFEQKKGSLDENNIKQINEWLVTEGGIALLGAHIILSDTLSNSIASLQEGLNPEQNEDFTFEDLQLDGDGWLRLTQPCGTQETSKIVLSTLFSTNGIDPRFFGTATTCEMPEYQVIFDADISFLAPLDIPFVDPNIWQGSEGTWFFFDGHLQIYDFEISSAFDIMVDSEEQIGILWEHENYRFVISIPELQNIEFDLDFEIDNIEELEHFGIEIQTEDGIWNCMLVDRSCNGPNNQSIVWL